jgi:REP-associated tyrosine transposase
MLAPWTAQAMLAPLIRLALKGERRQHGCRSPKGKGGSMAAAVQKGGCKLDADVRDWHHRPLHIFSANTMYIVTGSTLQKRALFEGCERLSLLQRTLFEAMVSHGWELQAWAVFANHYHFVAQASDDASSLKQMIQRLHSQTARVINGEDGMKGRRVWFQYWDTCLTYEKSYYPRLNYVHNNPVKHGLVARADQYPFCSAAWFERNAEPGFRRKVESFRFDRVKVPDDF